MRILVGIPCFNCEKQIQRVLPQLDGVNGYCDFLIVDNKSEDGTFQVIKNWKQNHLIRTKVKILQHAYNYGLGGTFKTIVNEAISGNYDFLFILHGDDQATIADLKQMINKVQESPELDCILGARFMRGSVLNNYSTVRKWGNKFINLIYSIFLGRRIYEIGSGINGYKISALPLNLIPHFPNHIAFDIHLLFHFINKRYIFWPITWNQYDQVSNANNVDTGLTVLKMLILHLIGKDQLNEELSQREIQEIIE